MSEFTGQNANNLRDLGHQTARQLERHLGAVASAKTVFGNLSDHIDRCHAEIDRLTAELAAKDPDWTPITSVEQVAELPHGFYELDYGHDAYGDILDVQVKAVHLGKKKCDWHLIHGDGCHAEKSIFAIQSDFESYRLIHAFKEPEKKGNFTYSQLVQIADPQSTFVQLERELARDLIAEKEKLTAAQERIRELGGRE